MKLIREIIEIKFVSIISKFQFVLFNWVERTPVERKRIFSTINRCFLFIDFIASEQYIADILANSFDEIILQIALSWRPTQLASAKEM